MNKTIQFLLAVTLIAILALPGCSKDDEGAIKIGASLPLTGGFSINGQKHKDGYEMCVFFFNDKGWILFLYG